MPSHKSSKKLGEPCREDGTCACDTSSLAFVAFYLPHFTDLP